MNQHFTWCARGELCEVEEGVGYHSSDTETTDHKWTVATTAVVEADDTETTIFMNHPWKLPVEERGALSLEEADQLSRMLRRQVRAARRAQRKSEHFAGTDDSSASAGARPCLGADSCS